MKMKMKKKRFYAIIFALVAGHYCAAQQSGQNEWAISFSNYFESDSTTKISVNLYAKPYYMSASWQSKSFVIDNIMSMRNKKVAYVSYGHRREVWGKDATQTVRLLDTLDMSSSNLKEVVKESQKLIRHPWFFNFGGQGMFSSEYLNLSSNARIGFFLLLDKWDLALSQGWSVSGNIEEEVISGFFTGLSSKYYFPMTISTTIGKQRISPYLGGGISYAYDDSMEEWQIDLSALAGVSWALGPGSLDIGIQYGKVSKFALTAGYTFFPWGR
jgi:hypothetical protein